LEAHKRAAQTTEPKIRDAFESVAEGWFELAEQLDCLDRRGQPTPQKKRPFYPVPETFARPFGDTGFLLLSGPLPKSPQARSSPTTPATRRHQEPDYGGDRSFRAMFASRCA